MKAAARKRRKYQDRQKEHEAAGGKDQWQRRQQLRLRNELKQINAAIAARESAAQQAAASDKEGKSD